MDAADFLAHVTSDQGYYCAVGLGNNGKRVQKFFDTRDKLLACAEQFDRNGLNAYYAMATFRNGESREAANAYELKSFYADLDCGPGKEYPTQRHALADLKVFVSDTGLPKPLIVNSGRGVHAYWVLDEALPVAIWKPLSSKFKQLLIEHDVRIDKSVTADAARILRVPGTRNHKDDPPKPVSVVGSVPPVTTIGVLKPIFLGGGEEPMVFEVPDAIDIEDDPSLSKLMGGFETHFRVIMRKSIAGKGCAQLLNAYTDQENTSEPVWRAALSIAKHCDEGVKAAHKLSNKHPEYDREETERKFNLIESGPYTCDTFDDLRPGICAGCPHFGKIKSPIVLGRVVSEAEETFIEGRQELTAEGLKASETTYSDTVRYKIPEYPRRYFRGSEGGVFERPASEDDDPKMVYLNDFYFVLWTDDPEEGQSAICRLHLPHKVVREFSIPLKDLTSREEMRKIMSRHGVVAVGKEWDRIMTYSRDWIHKLQATTQLVPAVRQYGWVDEEALDAFVVGDRRITANDVTYTPPSSKTHMSAPWFKPSGTLEGWKENAAFYNDCIEKHPMQFMVLYILGAPLGVFMPDVNAAIFNLWSDKSGHGKTTAQFVGLAAYAEPKVAAFRNQDTENSRFNRMELFKNLPLVVDEITNWKNENLSNVIYDTTGGMQKARMTSSSNTERYRGDPWITTVTMSANDSLRQKLLAVKGAPEAEQMRMLEYYISTELDSKEQKARQKESTAMVARIRKHRGHAVVPFVQYIMNNKDHVKERFDYYVDKLTRDCDLTQQHRYYKSIGAVVMTACEIANATDLLQYDARSLYRWTVNLIKTNIRQVEGTKVDANRIFADFMSDNYNKFLVIDSGTSVQGLAEIVETENVILMPDKDSKTDIVGRYEPDTRLIYFILTKFQEWCVRNKYNPEAIKRMLLAEFNGEMVQKKIAKGTKLPLGNQRVIKIDVDRNQLDVSSIEE